jgi:hypothetical protein
MKIIITESQLKSLQENDFTDWVDKTKQGVSKKIQSVKSNIQGKAEPYLDNLPLHHKCAIYFMQERQNVLTEKDLSQENLNTLSNMICEKAIRLGSCDPSRWTGKDLKQVDNKNHLGYNDMSTSYSKSPNYNGKTFSFGAQPQFIKEIMLTLGNLTVTKSGSGWVVNDVYDFKNILEKKTYLKTDNFFKQQLFKLRGVLVALAGAVLPNKSFVPGIEEILAQKHNSGYNGYNVRINVPFNGCKCKG